MSDRVEGSQEAGQEAGQVHVLVFLQFFRPAFVLISPRIEGGAGVVCAFVSQTKLKLFFFSFCSLLFLRCGNDLVFVILCIGMHVGSLYQSFW